jgi:3-(3-hydroxy-phenyl)propionate hydroxylase
VAALPATTELLVTENYPGASAHTVLLVRPDGHLVAAFSGVRPAELFTAAQASLGGAPGSAREPGEPEDGGDERSAGREQRPGARVHADGAAGIT